MNQKCSNCPKNGQDPEICNDCMLEHDYIEGDNSLKEEEETTIYIDGVKVKVAFDGEHVNSYYSIYINGISKAIVSYCHEKCYTQIDFEYKYNDTAYYKDFDLKLDKDMCKDSLFDNEYGINILRYYIDIVKLYGRCIDIDPIEQTIDILPWRFGFREDEIMFIYRSLDPDDHTGRFIPCLHNTNICGHINISDDQVDVYFNNLKWEAVKIKSYSRDDFNNMGTMKVCREIADFLDDYIKIFPETDNGYIYSDIGYLEEPLTEQELEEYL